MDDKLTLDPEDLKRTVDALKDEIDKKIVTVLLGKLLDDPITSKMIWDVGVPSVDSVFRKIRNAFIEADRNRGDLFRKLRDDPLMRRFLWLGEPELSVDEAFDRIRNCFAAHRPVEEGEVP